MIDAFGANNRKPEDSYHVITTDNALFESLGMSVFTTGTMWEFLTHEDGQGQNNFRYFGGIDTWGNPAPRLFDDMGFIFTADGSDLAYWMESYDPNTNKHASKEDDKDILKNWSFTNKSGAPYAFDDLPNLGDDRTYSSSEGLDPANAKRWRDDYLNVSTPNLTHTDVFGLEGGPKIAMNVIETNNWVRLKKQKEGKKAITEWSSEGSVTKEQAIAAFYWIADIKSSKRGGLEWVSKITFNLTPGLDTSDPEACLKTEPVTFKLRLFDDKFSRDSTRTIVSSAPIVAVGKPVHEFGVDGRIEDGLPVDETTETVQPVDIISDSISGKGRSGSLQIIAKLTTDVEPAKDELDVDTMRDKSAGEDFDNYINELYEAFIPGTGEAIPLQAQNKNPNQWTPVWSDSKCAEEGNTPKLVKVKNFAKRKYDKDTTVLLNQLGGSPKNDSIVWCIIDFGEEPVTPVSQTFEGRWDFTYLMANGDHYFRKWKPDGSEPTDGHESFKNKDYEKQFRHQYYKSIQNSENHKVNEDDGALNWSIAGGGLGPEGTTVDPKEIDFAVDPDGYYQITSWDFMHEEIGGTRGTHNSIVQTIAQIESDNTEVGEPESQHGFQQLPFFGAVFPGGYDQTKVSQDYKNNLVEFEAIDDPTAPVGFWKVNSPGKPFGDSESSHNYKDDPKGMFSDTLVDAGLIHFPADMALNAHWRDAKNGRPISNVGWMKKHLTLENGNIYKDSLTYFANREDFSATSIDPSLSGIPARYSYLRKKLNGEAAFDLSPISKSKVQFRPLQAETYLSFVGTDDAGGSGPGGTNPNSNGTYRLLAGAYDFLYGGNYGQMLTMAEKAWNSQNGNGSIISPISPVFLERNGLTIDPVNPNNQGPKASHSLDHGFTANGRWPDEVWKEFNASGAQVPANAFGVIGAVSTVKSVGSNSLSFDVGCNIGIQNGGGTTRGGGFNTIGGIIGGIMGGVSVSVGPDRTSDEVYYWGSSFDNPESYFTTNLHARVFTAWPRNLTVYDTRFYAVHHFNYGVGLEEDIVGFDVHHQGKAVDNETLLGDGTSATSALAAYIMPPNNGRMEDANSLYISTDLGSGPIGFKPANYPDSFVGETGVYYPVDKIEVENADFREPTYSNKASKTDNTFVLPGVDIFKDSPLRAAGEWRVNIKARGKLLPFKHNRRTIGIGKVGDPLYPVDRKTDTSSISSSKVVAEDFGTGYQVGDTFTTSGGGGTDVVLKIVQIGVLAMDDPAFEIVNPGKDFQVDAFSNQYESDGTTPATVSESTDSQVQIVPLSLQGNGSGFRGWITFGEVVNTEEEIAKPAECGQELISPATKNQGLTNVNGYRQFITWDDDKRASDDKYDVFLYFHNDIGHTLSYVADYGTPPFNSYQQWIDLTVLPN